MMQLLFQQQTRALLFSHGLLSTWLSCEHGRSLSDFTKADRLELLAIKDALFLLVLPLGYLFLLLLSQVLLALDGCIRGCSRYFGDR